MGRKAVGFEEPVQEAEDSSPVGRIDSVIADVRKGPGLDAFVLQKAFHVGLGDIFCVVVAQRGLAGLMSGCGAKNIPVGMQRSERSNTASALSPNLHGLSQCIATVK